MRINPLIFLLSISLILGSCKNTLTNNSGKKIRLDKPNESFLLTQYRPSFFTLKAQAEFIQGPKSTDFKLELRMKSDSTIWIDIADPFIGLRIVRVLVRPDSAFMVNKLDKTYFKGDLESLTQMAGIGLNFAQLQEILWANFPIIPKIDSIVPRENEKLSIFPKQASKPDMGTLSNAAIHISSVRPLSYTYVPESSSISLHSRFERSKENSNSSYPSKLFFKVGGPSNVSLSLEISDYSTEKKPLPFKIPANYKALP